MRMLVRNTPWVLSLLLLMLANPAHAQSVVLPEKGFREVGLNVTGLIGQIVPFNRGGGKIGPYGLSLHAISPKGRGIRFSIGAALADGNDSRNNTRINLLIGKEKRKPMSEKFTLRKGTFLYYTGGDFNSPILSSDINNDTAGLAIGRGIAYHPFEHVSISAEALLYIGIVSEAGQIVLLPPLGVNLNVKF